ncbi:MAG: exodeoxyribonuclease VII small subunit [Bacteroidaceae bacterium]|nr:exodeoxyribonuclease VII small subunit [Bacteroidaceae bacterium]
MKEKNLKYDDALKRLEELSVQMEQGNISIDDMSECMKEAQQLVAYCRQRLADADARCNALLES